MNKSDITSRLRGLPPMPKSIYLSRAVKHVDTRRIFFILLGLALFCVVYFSPPWDDAIDPQGEEMQDLIAYLRSLAPKSED